MFKKMIELAKNQFNKMKNFDSENEFNKYNITQNNSIFSKNLDEKISSSQSRISEIRKSIRNTKL
ncbi:hypothetical protein [Clostridium beijerinckii]|uniref:Uncharacterized protein n=1 Tax=Clostridium beijerinckii TaxID=1520 RepID=A0AAE5LRC9_CLOBE|nr:hypothetical protein [Clostridium beijerinckii]NSB15812.1 hypothetical protein [Clostridium beijerinckii]OOM19426.1 hypothetical protein CLOBE_53290 [Clostridium beijerinckii]